MQTIKKIYKKIILFFIINTISFAYINLYPLEFNKNITKGAFQEFVLYNRSTKPVRYRIYIEEVPNRNSMKDWIEVYPKSITLNSLEEDSIRVYVQSPEGTKEGIYEANLVIKEISLPQPKLTEEEKNKKHNILTMVKLRLKGSVKYEN
ncbi:MAG: hypothetical protein MR673_03260 [Fusobacterium perfoetens]|uniref:hypothetical protein n=1 Tax=Fusobacterium perfoetens TaxID=852 RepID=UPI0023F3865D|nr:hypothetical protein [Fusobacterium perfoetens]MCI6152130.1 hypothetical protein [Fusobacterium perfoetens]MDY3237979.1 hypothetical protein [Fusobacterium perfoetens]